MIWRTDRLVVALVAAGVLTCAATAFVLRPAPVPESAGAQWTALDATWGTAVQGRTFTIDTVQAGATQHSYAGRPERVRRGVPLEIHGWAYDAKEERTADALDYRLDGGHWVPTEYRIPRTDVAAAFDLPKVWNCGFTIRVAPAALAPGIHTIELSTVASGSRTLLPARLAVRVVSAG